MSALEAVIRAGHSNRKMGGDGALLKAREHALDTSFRKKGIMYFRLKTFALSLTICAVPAVSFAQDISKYTSFTVDGRTIQIHGFASQASMDANRVERHLMDGYAASDNAHGFSGQTNSDGVET